MSKALSLLAVPFGSANAIDMLGHLPFPSILDRVQAQLVAEGHSSTSHSCILGRVLQRIIFQGPRRRLPRTCRGHGRSSRMPWCTDMDWRYTPLPRHGAAPEAAVERRRREAPPQTSAAATCFGTSSWRLSWSGDLMRLPMCIALATEALATAGAVLAHSCAFATAGWLLMRQRFRKCSREPSANEPGSSS